jgi:arginine:pyruvate transaminase
MEYANRVARLAGEAANAWQIHTIADARKNAGQDIIMLSIGDTDFASPDIVVEEAYASLKKGRTNYANCSGIEPLRQAIAERHSRKTGLQTTASQVVVTQGAQNALFNVAQCLIDPGCEVIVPEPMYVTYPATIEGAGANLVKIESRAENNFHPTVDDIKNAITEKTRAIFLATPNNPTGAVYTVKELEGIAQLCRAHDLWLVSDEVYGDLTYDQDHASPMTLPDMLDRTVVISSLSKSHAMAGWRLGWAIVPEELALHMDRLALCSTYGTPTFIQDAAIVAISELPMGIIGMKAKYEQRIKKFCSYLDGLQGLSCRQPEGGMFAMLDVRESGLSSYDYAMKLLNDQGISTLPADAFGPSAKGFLRINLGANDSLLDEAATRIEAFQADLIS